MKIFIKILLAPVILAAVAVLGLAWILTKLIMGVYNIFHSFFIGFMAILTIAVIICYQDVASTIFCLLLAGVCFGILFVGSLAEVLLETAITGICGKWVHA